MNESYTSFAQVYDMFMDNVDYPAWSKYLIQLLKEYQVEDGLCFVTRSKMLKIFCASFTVFYLSLWWYNRCGNS